jgi:hypothetical protein
MNLKFLNSVDWQQLPNKREKVIFSVALLVFLFVFVRSCWGPSINAIGQAKKELKTVRDERSAMEALVGGQVSKTQKAFEWKGDIKKRAYYDELAKKLADDPDIVLMNNFSNPATLRDVKITNIDMPDSKTDNGITKQAWTVSAAGSFIAIGEYISRLEAQPLLFVINGINIQSSGDAFGRVNADIKGESYGWK